MISTILKLHRKWFSDKSTIGELHENDDPAILSYTLEDVLRLDGVKVPGATCIPAGTYEVIINFSQRFGRPMPLLLDVPGFQGIRIHSGNTAADTEGCVLVGQERGEDVVTNSRMAFAPLFSKIKEWVDTGKLYIQISNDVLPAAGVPDESDSEKSVPDMPDMQPDNDSVS
jgi:Family of unknown function (DUF5675)